MAARHHLARPPYVDPNTNIIYDTDNAEYEGWLTKQSMWLKVRVVIDNRISCPFWAPVWLRKPILVSFKTIFLAGLAS